MGVTLSRGPTELRAWILAYLEYQVPLLITQARTDWGLDEYELPSVAKFDAYDAPIADKYPTIGCYFQNEVNFDRRDYSDKMEEEYWVTHQGQVAIWVQTPYTNAAGALPVDTRGECLRLRDDLTELVKQALLLTPSLSIPDVADHTGDAWLEETSIAVNKTEPFRAKENNPMWIAGSLIPINYKMRNELMRAALGVANTINVTVHPADE